MEPGSFQLAADEDDAYSQRFVDVVNDDLFGTEGVEELLEAARAVCEGGAPPLEQHRNVHTISISREEVVLHNDYTEATVRCPTDQFVGFLQRVLDDLG